MKNKSAAKPTKELTLDVIHESFETDFESLKQRVRIAEENIHSDACNINRHVSEIIQEERDQKKTIMTMMGCIVALNITIAIVAIITVVLISQH